MLSGELVKRHSNVGDLVLFEPRKSLLLEIV